MTVDNIIKKIAKQQHTTPERVRREMEKAIEEGKREFLCLAKKDDLNTIKKSLPKGVELRNNWFAAALKQKECGKHVREYLLKMTEKP